jgi:hypothetical protein
MVIKILQGKEHLFFRLPDYYRVIVKLCGCRLIRVFRPFDSVGNALPIERYTTRLFLYETRFAKFCAQSGGASDERPSNPNQTVPTQTREASL